MSTVTSKNYCGTKNQAKCKTILERLNCGEVIIGDGGYVTELERRGFVTAGHWTPEVNLEHPDAVEGLHKEFARAGSDILQAYTYHANDRINTTNQANLTDSANEAACQIVKKVALKYDCLWAGGLSSTLLYLSGRSASKEEVQAVYRKQINTFLKHNADLLIAEFCEELEWAVQVMKETDKPAAACLCVNSMSDNNGVPTEECAVRLVKAGADIIGVNCKFDPSESLKAIAKMKEGLKKAGLKAHLMLQPLGFHCPDGGKNGYVNQPEFPFGLEPRLLTRWDVHKISRSAYDLGVRFIGGCCGYKAYHIRAIAEELAEERGRMPESSEKHKPFVKGHLSEHPGIRSREYWLNLKPASGRPLCPAFSEPVDGST